MTEVNKNKLEDPVLFEKDAWAEGFTWRTVIGAVFVAMVIMPGSIYMGLVTGSVLSGVAEWVVIILFIEIGKRSFVSLKKQEIIILFAAATGVMSAGAALGSGAQLFGGPFSQLIWNQYLVQSPQAQGFGITNYIPSWLVPSDVEILNTRSFLHAAWVKPILLVIIHVVLTYVLIVAMGYFFYRITNDIERLPFPMAPVSAGGATALAETSGKREGWRWRVFSIGAMIGVAFGAVYGGVPTITGALASRPIMILPIPFADATAQIGQIPFLRAALLGLSFDLLLVMVGFVLPFRVVFGIFTGSMLCGVVLNPILQHLGVLHSWEPGMSLIPTVIVNGLDFYISLGIGLALTVAAIGIGGILRRLLFRKRSDKQATTGQERADLTGRGQFSLFWTSVIIVAVICSYVAICHILVPDFPVFLLLLFGFVYTPLVSYITARLVGITGAATGASFPYVRESAFILSGYKGADIWFAPVPLFDMGAAAQRFKELELTRTKFVSLVKVNALSMVLMLVFSFLFLSLIWKLGPIPSSTYPFVQKMWPLYATGQSLWASSTLASDRIVADALGHDISVMPLFPDEQTTAITPPGDGYQGTLMDLRPGRGAAKNIPPGAPVIAIVEPGQKEALDRLSQRQLVAVIFALPGAEPSPEKIKDLRQRYTQWPLARYSIAAEHADNLLAQLSDEDPVSIKRRKNFLMEAISPKFIGVGTGAAAVLFLGAWLLGGPAAFVYGMIGGYAVWPHMAIPQMVGALLGRYVIARRLGEVKWRAYVPILAAGYACGFGLLLTICVGIALLAKAVSQMII